MKLITIICVTLSLALFALVSRPAMAHGGHEHVVGTVAAVDSQGLTVTTREDKSVRVTVDEHTKYERDGAPAALKDVASGQRVVVHASLSAGALVAEEVKVATADKKQGGQP